MDSVVVQVILKARPRRVLTVQTSGCITAWTPNQNRRSGSPHLHLHICPARVVAKQVEGTS